MHRHDDQRISAAGCRVYWGSHGCERDRGHEGFHYCDCCGCEDHDGNRGEFFDEEVGYDMLCVATWPYYGEDTFWYGEDAVVVVAT